MPYSACVRCQNCDGFPCAVHGKSDADVLGVRPALEHPNVELLTNAKAVRLETEPGGTAVSTVVVEREGELERYEADLVVLACGAANTANLLLLSATDEHPNGLANGSDQVGRNYMFHNSQAVLALSVNREGKLTLAYTATNEKPKQELYKQLHSMLAKLRMEPGHLFHRFAYMKNEIPVAGVAHQAGTCRMGTDPSTSVVNVDCRAHELDNLYVVDTSVFPSIGAVNPALTAMANSLRVGDHLRDRLK
jgi:choline dehydrogenase-like flavoprotein